MKSILFKIFTVAIVLLCFLIPGKSKSAADDLNVRLMVGEFCGDDIINGTEQCDDGNNNDGDGCSTVCVLEFCGDAIVNNTSEVCDSNTQPCITANGYNGNQLCNGTCNGWNACISTESCGDGTVNGNEACDDGNNIDCDGCRSDCTRMDNICGDGYSECSEECDGNNGLTNGFRCADQCVLISESGNSIFPEMLDPINVYQIFVRVSEDIAVINWATNKNSFCSLEWGETPDLTNEKIQELNKTRDHHALLSNLNSSTNYYYKLLCHDSWGHHRETEISFFKTLEKIDNEPPANVENFRAIALNGVINLYWNNPQVKDLQAIKIIRREDRFPEQINDGVPIYNGKNEKVTDINVKPGRIYYYTAYAYDNDGNFSSGAIASVRIILPGAKVKLEEGKTPPNPFLDKDTSVFLPFAPIDSLNIDEAYAFKLDIRDLFASAASETVKVDFLKSNKIISLPGAIMQFKYPQDKTPKILKSILLSIVPKNSIISLNNYLLRIDKEEKFYNTVINMPLKVGDYDLILTLIDYKHQKVGKTKIGITILKFGQLEYYNYAANNYLPTTDAFVTLYKFDNDQLDKWPGIKFSQYNPMISNSIGQYGFFVPNGEYVVKAEKKGFYSFSSPIYKVTNNIFNEDIEMVAEPYFNWPLFISEVLFGLLLYISLRILLKIIKNLFF